jgi:hypothetical protein
MDGAAPQQQDDLFDLDTATEKIAERYGVPSSVWRRMVGQESGGDASAVSPKGARSAWQIMPATAKGLGIDSNDPLQAAEGGLRILRDNFKRFRPLADNDKHAWMMAVAGYHTNPNNVERDVKAGGYGLPNTSDGLITTRNHVLKIFDGLKGEELDRSPLQDLNQKTLPPKLPAAPKQNGLSAAALSYGDQYGATAENAGLAARDVQEFGNENAPAQLTADQRAWQTQIEKQDELIKDPLARLAPTTPLDVRQTVVPDVAPPVQKFGQAAVVPLGKLRNPQPTAQSPKFSVEDATPEQLAQANRDFEASNQELPRLKDLQTTDGAATNLGFRSVGELIQSIPDGNVAEASIDLRFAPKGGNVGEYIFRNALQQVAPRYGLSEADIEWAVRDQAKEGAFVYNRADNQPLTESEFLKSAKNNQLSYVVSGDLIKRMLAARGQSVDENLRNEDAEREKLRTQITDEVQNPTLVQSALNLGDTAISSAYRLFTDPIGYGAEMAEYANRSPEEQARLDALAQNKQIESRYKESLAPFGGSAASRAKSLDDWNRHADNLDLYAQTANELAKVPGDWAASVLKLAAMADAAGQRYIAGDKSVTADTNFLGEASKAVQDSFERTFRTNPAAAQSSTVVAAARPLGNIAGLIIVGTLPGGQAALPALMASQGAQIFYEDAKKHGASEDAKLTAGALGAVLSVPQILNFQRWFRGLPPNAQSSFVQSFAQSVKQGAAGNGVQVFGQNVAARQLGYDAERPAGRNVSRSLGEGALIGAVGGAFQNRGRVVDVLRGAKETLDDLAKIPGQAKNAAETADKLDDILERAEQYNAAPSAEVILQELAPDLAKLPRRVREQIEREIKAAVAETPLDADTAAQLRITDGSTAAPEFASGPTTDFETAKAGSSTSPAARLLAAENAPLVAQNKPVTETTETLEAQYQATFNPESAKKAVLFTDPGTAPSERAGELRVITSDGAVLIGNPAKVSDAELRQAAENPQKLAELLGKPLDSYGQNNPVAVSRDANGNELSATQIASEAEANAAFQKDNADYRGQIASQTIETPEQVTGERTAKTTALAPSALPDSLVAALSAPPSKVSGNQPNAPTASSAPFTSAETAAPPASSAQTTTTKTPVARVINNSPATSGTKQTVYTERGTKADIATTVINADDLLTSLDAGYPQEFQPRNRDRKASQSQISSIAQNLNPEFLGDSPKASDGRPLVVPVEVDGKTKYAVISGNGRTAAIRQAYESGNPSAQKYKDYVAGNFGGDSLQKPVYVGVLNPSEVNLESFAREANEQSTQAMSATEQAASDAKVLADSGLINSFVPSETGEIHAAANRDFVRGFVGQVISEAERNRFVDENFNLSQDGERRVRNAIFAAAFGDNPAGLRAIARFAESTDSNVRNISNALLKVAGRFADLKAGIKDGARYAELDITSDISTAVEKLVNLRGSGQTVDDYLKQGGLFGDDLSPFQKRLVTFFDNYKRSGKGIAGVLHNYLILSENFGNPQQTDLFGGSPKIDAPSVFAGAVQEYEAGNQTTNQSAAQTSLFDSGQGRETRPAANNASAATAAPSEPSSQQIETVRETEGQPPSFARLPLQATYKGQTVEIIKAVSGRVRVKFSDGTTRTVKRGEIDAATSRPALVRRGSVDAEQPALDKMVRDVEAQAASNAPTENLLQAAEITHDGKLAFANAEAIEVLRRSFNLAFGGELDPFFGVYLKPAHIEKVAFALMKMRTELETSAAKRDITGLLNVVRNPVYTDKGLPIVAVSKDLPAGATVAVEEELSHQADILTRGNIPARIFLRSRVLRKAVRRVRETYDNVSVETLATEAIGKMFRTDAAEELGLTDDELTDARNSYFELLLNKGVNTETVSENFENVSPAGKEFASNARQRTERTDSRFTGSSRQARPDRAEAVSAPFGSLRAIQNSRQSGQTNQGDGRTGSGATLSRGVFNPPLRNAGLNALERLTPRERSIIKARLKNQAAMQEQAAEELLFSKTPPDLAQSRFGQNYGIVRDKAAELVSIPKSLKSSVDLSAAMRQGAPLTLTEPRFAVKAFGQQLKSLASRQYYENFVDDLMNHPYAGLADASELYLASLADSESITAREEAFMSRLLGQDRVFQNKYLEGGRLFLSYPARVSERAYTTYLDSIRMATFTKLAKNLHEYNARKGRADDIGQYQQLARFINIATGRGDLGKLEGAAVELNIAFFSARYLASRFQLLNPIFYASLPPGVRQMAVKKMVGFAGATAAIMSLLALGGGEIELENFENPDFLKVKFGNTRYDFGAGIVQPLRFLLRVGAATGEKKPLDKITRLTRDFGRTKLAPVPGSVVNLVEGQNIVGEKVTYGGEALNQFTPLMLSDLYKATQDEGLEGAAKTLPAVLGVGVQTYQSKRRGQSKKEDEDD